MSAPPVRPRRRNRSMVQVADRPGSLFTPESAAPATEKPIVNYQGPQENIELPPVSNYTNAQMLSHRQLDEQIITCYSWGTTCHLGDGLLLP